MSEEKTAVELLKEKLEFKPKNGYDVLSEAEIEKAYAFCEGYKAYLDASKTEREAVKSSVKLAEENGFVPYSRDMQLKAGDRVYFINRDRAAAFAVIGKEALESGLAITVAHIDSPRLDLKQRPLYEDNELAMLKTHYYGGIKKYQWLSIPLALYGTVVLKDGSKVDVSIGDGENDPVFCVSDLLPHLGKNQMSQNAGDIIAGEQLNIIVGTRPFKDTKEAGRVKLNILAVLNEKYGMTEEDFLSADFELVPAGKAVDVAMDRSLIGAYGHDDRVCAYTELMGLFDAKAPSKTLVCLLADREETGSDGNTGMQSDFLDLVVRRLSDKLGGAKEEIYAASKCLSADVNAAFDPNFPDVLEKNNAAFLNYGVAVTKYTGHRGKYDTSEASAEFVSYIRKLFDSNNVLWQMAALGKVDQGGGGTVAKYVARRNVDVIDVGVPLLAMHAPFEIASKLDIYMAYKAFSAFNCE